jgi:crotonobetainyl-CoA:carnitine CoA-transferase CaiB-like acyl-CoA transferase
MGASVVKVEDTGPGDLSRIMPPLVDGVGWIFRVLNYGKQSVALNLKTPEGQHVAQQLAGRCDVVVEGFRPGVTERLGIDFVALSPHNVRLVYCSISGYGQEGELRDLPGHDLTYAAMSGLLEALSPGQPRVPGVQVVDSASSLLAAVRILAALHHTDAGPQYLDVSLYDAALALMPLNLAEASLASAGAPSLLDALRGGERNDVYRCADGRFIAITPLEEGFWQRLCALLRRLQLIDASSVPSSEQLHTIMAQRTCDEWFALLAGADIPCAPVRSVHVEPDHPAAAPPAGPGAAPALGEHTQLWLEELGYDADQIRGLEERGAIRSV